MTSLPSLYSSGDTRKRYSVSLTRNSILMPPMTKKPKENTNVLRMETTTKRKIN